MKAFNESHSALAERAGLILLLTEKLIPPIRDHDENNRADILTSGIKPYSRLPGLVDQWLWKLVTRYSGATVPDSHGVP